MHPTALFSADRRRHTGFAGTRLCPAALTRQHRASVTRMTTPLHFFVLAATGVRTGFSIIGIAGCRASVRAGLDRRDFFEAAPGTDWVTLPTIAWPPSLTDTCCTVTFCSPPVRWRFSASICIMKVRIILLSTRSALSCCGSVSTMEKCRADRIAVT